MDSCRPCEPTNNSRLNDMVNGSKIGEPLDVERHRDPSDPCRHWKVVDSHQLCESVTNDLSCRMPHFKTQRESSKATNTTCVQPFGNQQNAPDTIQNESQCESKGLNLTSEETEIFFQWQWDKLKEKMDNEDCSPANMSVSISDHSEQDYGTATYPVDLGSEALRLYQKSKKMSMDHVADRFLLLVGRRLKNISKMAPFLSLEVGELCQILNNDYLGVPNERIAFRAAYRWLRHNPDQRQQYVSLVLSWVRYGLMQPADLIKCIFRSRQLLQTMLDVPSLPQSLLKGFICIQLQELGLGSSMKEFESVPRITCTYGPSCEGLQDSQQELVTVDELQDFGTSRRHDNKSSPSTQYATCEMVSTHINSMIRLNAAHKL